MKIALVSTCAVAVPPKAYGGTELVTAELAKMLTRAGHDVTVYATGDSRPEGQLRWHFPRPIWPPDDQAELRHAAFAWREIARGDFDVVHAHQAPSLAIASTHAVPFVLTIHHCRDERLLAFYKDFEATDYVAISARQRALCPEVRHAHVVHHGLDPSLYAVGAGEGGYCAFLGRLAPEKGVHTAVDASKRAGVPLRVAGGVHAPDREYFEQVVRPRFAASPELVSWLGEVSHEPKVELLRHARALLFPIDWEEPFGLVMIESMLVGTPVIAFARGSVPEVVEEGVTGFIVRDDKEMAERIRQLDAFDRRRCRERAEERWSSQRMAREYERVYESAIRRQARPRRTSSGFHVITQAGERPTGTE